MRNFKDLIFEGGVEGLVMNFMHSLGQTAEQKGGDYLKSKLFGIGTNDEHLFLAACAYAVEQKMITSEELIKVCEVIDSYSSSQRNRIIGIIGKVEESIASESPKADEKDSKDSKDPKDSKDSKDKKTDKPVVGKANIKGAQILAMLAKLDKKAMKKVLDTSGASVTATDRLKHTIKETTKKVEKSQVIKDGNGFFAQETWLERLAREKSSI